MLTRSVLDALLKRGSSVVLGCSDTNIGLSELERVRYEAERQRVERHPDYF